MKAIPGFPNYYVTKNGRIRSKPRNSRKGKWMKLKTTPDGHLQIILRNKDRKFTRLVHRLVLETYVGQCPEGMECRHLDGNPQNNKLTNLCWGTHSENQHDSVQHGTHVDNRGEKHGMAKLTGQIVKDIRSKYNTKLFTQQEIADIYDISNSNVSLIVNKKAWKHIWCN